MNGCRVASRVGLIAPAHIACIQGEGAPTNAAKVSRCSPLLFLPGGGRRARPLERCLVAVVRSLPGGWLSVGLGLPAASVVGRRVASNLAPTPTPSFHSAIAANECGGEW